MAVNVRDNPEARGVFLEIVKVDDGHWRAELRCNVTSAGLTGMRLGGEGPTPASALDTAGRFADAALKDPIINAALPPGSTLAISAVRELARAAQRGDLQHVTQAVAAPALRAVSTLLSDVTHGLLSGFGPMCLVCADGSLPVPRGYETSSQSTADLSTDKRFPFGPPSMPVPPDPGIPPSAYLPPGYPLDPRQQAAALLGHAHAIAIDRARRGGRR